MFKKISAFIFIIFAMLFVTACKKDEFTVTFDTGPGSNVSSQKVEKGKKATEPPAPTYDGFDFGGWYKESTHDTKWRFTVDTVEEDITLYAKWDPKTVGPVSCTIPELYDLNPNTLVEVTGTVYLVESTGFYMADSASGRVYVESNHQVEVGNVYKVSGTYKENNVEKPYVTATNVLASTNTAYTYSASESSVNQITAVSNTVKPGSWYKLVTLIGKIYKDDATEQVMFMDDAGDTIAFSDNSASDVLLATNGERVIFNALVREYLAFGSAWSLFFDGTAADISLKPYTQDEVEAIVEDYLDKNVTKDIYGYLQLPAIYSEFNGLSITWESDNAAIVIEGLNASNTHYQTTVVLPDADVNVKLTATVNYGELDEFEVEIDVVVKYLPEMSLAEAIASENPLVMFRAVVVGLIANQNITQRSLILQDETNPTVIATVEFYSSSGFGQWSDLDAEVGDIVLLTGSIAITGGRYVVNNLLSAVQSGETTAPNYPYSQAIELTDEASWKAFNQTGVLVKFVNPYLVYSTSGAPSDTNWIRLGYNEESPSKSELGSGSQSIAFLIREFDLAMGGSDFRNNLSIPYYGDPAIQFEGVIYAYVIYSSASYLSTFIVSVDHVQPSDKQQIIMDIKNAVPGQVEEGNLNLFTTHPKLPDGTIAWSSNNLEIIANDGTITYPEYDTAVGLTATFTINGVEAVLEFEVTVMGQIKVVYQVDQVLEMTEANAAIFVEGFVLQAGYTTAVPRGAISDIFLQDKVSGNIINVQGSFISQFGTDFNVGDLIEINVAVVLTTTGNEAGKLHLSYNSGLTVISSENALIDYKQNAIEITNQDEMVDAFANNLAFGGVYKLVNPIMNTTSNTYSNTGSLYIRFHFNESATGSSEVAYGVGRGVVLNDASNRRYLGDNWVADLFGIVSGETYIGAKYPGIRSEKVVYIILKNGTASYYNCSMLSVDDVSLYEKDPEVIVEEDIRDAIPVTIGTGNITLPDAHDLVDEGSIYYQSSNDAIINPETGEVVYGADDVSVTLTVFFKIDDIEYSFEVEIVVMAPVPLSVAEILENSESGEIVLVNAIVVGFYWNGSSTYGALTHGMILKDATGNSVIYVTTLDGVYCTTKDKYNYYIGEIGSGHLIALGDQIKFYGTYNVQTAVAYKGRNEIAISARNASGLELVNSDVAYTFDLAQAEVVDSNEDLVAVAESLTFGKLYKLEGGFSLRSSVSAYGTGTNMSPAFNPADDAAYNQTVTWHTRAQRFSFKFDGNSGNLGDDWWESGLGIDSSNFGGITYNIHEYESSSYIYFYIGSSLPTATTNNGYIQLVILDEDWVSTTRTALSITKGKFHSIVPKTVVSGETIALPTEATGVDAGSISYSSADETLLNPSTGLAGSVTQNTNVVLTVSFTIGGVSHSFTVTVSVTAPEAP